MEWAYSSMAGQESEGMMEAFRCFDCKKLFRELHQYRDDRGRLVVSGYCEKCDCETTRPVEAEDDIEDTVENPNEKWVQKGK